MIRFLSAAALTAILMLSAFPAVAACFFIALREFHVAEAVEKTRWSGALASAFDMARVNAQELLVLGRDLRELADTADFDKTWVEYTRLVERLLAQNIPLRYQDDSGTPKQSSAPSLAFHPAWKNLGAFGETPSLPENWGIALPES